MDILIKNMEQIDGCYYCPFLTGTTCCTCLITGNKVGIDVVRDKYEDERMADCPLVALPEHGRLIDADQLQDILRLVLSLVISNELTEKEISLVHRTIGAISEAINDLDTVLEASNGTDS